MSRNGWFGPSDSSWLFGPEPETSTTAGNGPLPAGSVSVPFNGGDPTPTGICRTPAVAPPVGEGAEPHADAAMISPAAAMVTAVRQGARRRPVIGAGTATHRAPGSAGRSIRPATLPSRSKRIDPTPSPASKYSGTSTIVSSPARWANGSPIRSKRPTMPTVCAQAAARRVASIRSRMRSSSSPATSSQRPSTKPVIRPTARSAASSGTSWLIGVPVRGSTGWPNRWKAACLVVPSTSPISLQLWPASRARSTASCSASFAATARSRAASIASSGTPMSTFA